MSLKKNFYRRKLPDLCVSFASEKGKGLFKDALNSGYMESYFSLGPQLRTQDEPAYCGLSSLVMVLNALAVDPGLVWKGVWRWYHEDMLECCISLEEVKTKGVTLKELSCIAKCNQLESQHFHTTENEDIDSFRNLVKKTCQSDKVAIIATFGRSVLKQTGTGHFAPIGGYSPEEDHVLILEPARFKYPPFWVPLSLFWKAMCTIDEVTGQYRGYMVLSRSNTQPTLLFKISKTFHVVSPTTEESLAMFKHIIDFLQSKPENNDDDKNMETICKTIFEISTEHYKEKRNGFFFNSLTNTKMGELSPEHQEAVNALVTEIESLNLYKLVRSALESINCCQQTLFIVENNTRQCCGSCVLCLPHYMTIFLLVLPIFVEKSNRKDAKPKLCKIGKLEDEGTYFQIVRRLSAETSKSSSQDTMGRLLLSNEISQLQKQVISVFDQQKASCCGVC